MSCGGNVAKNLLVNTERNIPNDAKIAIANGEATIQINGKNANSEFASVKKQIQHGEPCEMFASAFEECSMASVLRALQ